MAFCDVMQKLLLCAELCFSIVAVVCFSRVLPGQTEDEKILGPVGCNVDIHTGLCFTSSPEALETAIKTNMRMGESNFALAILSLIIFIVRSLSWKLSYFPRYVNVLYDLLMSGLWCFSLAKQFTSTELAGCRYKHVGSIKALDICRLDDTFVWIAVAGILLYSGRVLVDAGSMLRNRDSIWLRENNTWDDAESRQIYEEELEKAHMASFSPVLAFFPDSPANTWRHVA